jgi:2-polyprenyl-6-methoxyphenol hydroxylase-like FAD-dependent oxidoreductase
VRLRFVFSDYVLTFSCSQVNDDGAKRETVFARYVIGADGAHSWTRRTLGINMEGDQTSKLFKINTLERLLGVYFHRLCLGRDGFASFNKLP